MTEIPPNGAMLFAYHDCRSQQCPQRCEICCKNHVPRCTEGCHIDSTFKCGATLRARCSGMTMVKVQKRCSNGSTTCVQLPPDCSVKVCVLAVGSKELHALAEQVSAQPTTQQPAEAVEGLPILSDARDGKLSTSVTLIWDAALQAHTFTNVKLVASSRSATEARKGRVSVVVQVVGCPHLGIRPYIFAEEVSVSANSHHCSIAMQNLTKAGHVQAQCVHEFEICCIRFCVCHTSKI